jgi:Uma2 family endonuclease
MTEVEILYPQNADVYRHDVVGFRRERHPARPAGLPVELRPDWVCEVHSPTTARVDVVIQQGHRRT